MMIPFRAPSRMVAGLVFALTLASTGGAKAAAPDRAQAHAALQHGRIDEATGILHTIIAASPESPEAHLLLCRAAYAEDHADEAVAECKLAVQQAPANSESERWLGKALGEKASHAGPFSALGVAKQAHAAFERAVQLDPANVDAASDLGEFYLGAPSILGGSQENARKLAANMLTRSPGRAHRLLGLIAQKQENLILAEQEYKLAISTGKASEGYIDLAIFYQKTNQKERVAEAVLAAIAADHEHGPVEVDAASILTEIHGDRQVAIQALRNYLRSDAQTDDAPVFKAHVQLGRLLAQTKDKDGARREFNAAIAMASTYQPARKALQDL